jgi:uncharacterized protein (TIRG00374 family)
MRLRSILSQVASFGLAGVLLYFSLRGVDFQEVGAALSTANYWWLIPLAIVAMVSHLLRAWRWRILLYELPVAQGVERTEISLYSTFSALIIGYMANYAAPRIGEVVRSGLVARKEGLNIGGVIGTVVVERVLDMAVLILALGGAALMLIDRLDTIRTLFIDPVTSQLDRLPFGILVTFAVMGLAGATYFIWWWRRRSVYREGEGGRLRRTISAFANGLQSLLRTRRRLAILTSTVLMWGCYAVMAHIPFLILQMSGPFEISLLDSWNIMAIGAIGVAIPAPGGTGSYHYITIQTLVHLFGVTQAAAATYAVVTHAAQLVLYTLLGAAFLLHQGIKPGSLKKAQAPAIDEDQAHA